MRHLLGVLRKDFEEPTNIPTCSTELEKHENGLLGAFLPHLESEGNQVKTKENSDLLPYASLNKYSDLPGYGDPLYVSTPVCSPERTVSPSKTTEKDGEDDNVEKGINSPCLSEHVSNNMGISEEEIHPNQAGTPATNEVVDENRECADQAEVSYDGHCKEVEDLGRSLSESLHVSSNTLNVENTEQYTNTAASGSDDEF